MHFAHVRRRAVRQLTDASHCTLEQLEGRRLLATGPVEAWQSSDAADQLPRFVTPAERKSDTNGGGTLAAPTPPPLGPIDSVAEYEDMEGLVISWASSFGSFPAAWTFINAHMT